MLKIKVKVGGTGDKKNTQPKIKAKSSGLAQNSSGTKIRLRAYRESGLGYDSEASDREDDPHIEQQFILRMCKGEDLEYLRKAVEEKTIGNGADFSIKFKDNRRAVVFVNGHMYSAKLVDLPCIIESSKTFDRKTIYKVADICQMLLVGDRIEDEEVVTVVPIKHSEYVYPHGLTPPLKWVRKRRFRKRLSHKTIEMIEAEVTRLLSLDAIAESSTYEVIPASFVSREGSLSLDNESSFDTKNLYKKVGYYENTDTVDIESENYNEADEDYLADQLEQAMMEVDNREESQAPTFTKETETPQDDSGSDDNEDSSEEMDEEMRWAADHQRLLDDEIAELNATIASNLEKLKTTTNPILQKRFEDIVRKLRSELDLKQSQDENKT
ncbi:unnamed protein product [Pneumocystis jirovecii]|uniref:TAFII55 protein conserved region domain-containing protein n=2 Tax=Pneumocystis jirovecii TaxID=42068 RepID=L0P816_PNEJI|nr:TATA-binding protein-associated factor TAF7 [Pneumocystis jirovecii RU7]KTW26575.1 hypothetical protein T551_03492 [Pneumocystis jirovecii RU7]CCJ28357.1 unnamed protein product [Pneumocystis jirovecii]